MRHFGGLHSIASRLVYRTREEAEEAVPAFRMACTTDPPDGSLTTMSDVEAMGIIELELVE